MIAPNGKQSNLTDSQYKLVRTPAFKEWFGDWENNPSEASKVVDENGEPLVVYHATTESFSVFDTKKIDIGTNTTTDGFFFSTNKEYIKKFSNKYLECFLKIKTPIIIDEKGKSKKLNKNEIDKVISNRIKDKNVDDDFLFDSKGFLDIIYGKTKKVQTSYGQLNYVLKYIFKNDYEDYSNRLFTETKIDGFFRQDTFICLFSNQIKLADGTNTTFDSNNKDIRFKDGGLIKKEKQEIISIQNKFFGDGLPTYKLSADGNWVMKLDFRTYKYKSYKRFDLFYESILEDQQLQYARENAKKVFEFLDNNGAELLNKSIDGASRYYSYKDNFIRVSNHWNQSEYKDKETGLNKYKVIENNFYSYKKDGWKEMISKIESIKLADGSNTTFNSNNPDIRFDGGGQVKNELFIIIKGVTNENKYKGNYKKIFDLIDKDLAFYNPYGTSFEELRGNDFYIIITPKPESFIVDEISKLKGVEIVNEDIMYKKGGMTNKGYISYKDKYNTKYGYSKGESHDLEEISKDAGVSMKGLQQIYNKGIGAYKTNPSSVRPNVKSKEQWAMARVYSSVMGGKASKIDSNELKMERGGILQDKNSIRKYAENLLKDFDYKYTGYSESNYGNSMYFDVDGIKCRFSDHTLTNRDRMINEINFSINDVNSESTKFSNNQSLLKLKYRLGDKSISYGKIPYLMRSGRYLDAFGYTDLKDSKMEQGGKLNRGGDCYFIAGQFVLNNDFINKIDFIGTPYLVHAEVQGQGAISHLRYGHAFIEDNVFVYDYSNNREIQLPKDYYYKIADIKTNNPKKYRKYTFKQAKEKMYETNKYGCWDLEVDYAKGGNVNFKNNNMYYPKQSLGLKRNQMPQIRKQFLPILFKKLSRDRIKYKDSIVSANTLKPSQNEINIDLTKTLNEEALNRKTIIVSSDNYIIDGHHRWYYAFGNNIPVMITKIDLPIEEALNYIRQLDFIEQDEIAKRGMLINSQRSLFGEGGNIEVEKYHKEIPIDIYEGIIGDFDDDGISNADDLKPNRKSKTKLEEVSLKQEITEIVNYRNLLVDVQKKVLTKIKKINTCGKIQCEIKTRIKTPYSIINKLRRRSLTDVKTLDKLDKKAEEFIKNKNLKGIDLYKGLTDILGFMVIVEDFNLLNKLKLEVESGKLGEVLEFEDLYKKNVNGYTAYHFLLSTEINGVFIPYELQLRTIRVNELAKITHTIYKQGTMNSKINDKISKEIELADKGNKAIAKIIDKKLENKELLKKQLTIKKLAFGDIIASGFLSSYKYKVRNNANKLINSITEYGDNEAEARKDLYRKYKNFTLLAISVNDGDFVPINQYVENKKDRSQINLFDTQQRFEYAREMKKGGKI